MAYLAFSLDLGALAAGLSASAFFGSEAGALALLSGSALASGFFVFSTGVFTGVFTSTFGFGGEAGFFTGG